MNNESITIRSAFFVVILSIISAMVVGWIVIGLSLISSETPSKLYTFLSVIIGQTFMMIPLLVFLKSRNEPMIERLRLNSVSKYHITNALFFSIGLTILSDELDRIIQIFVPQPDYLIDLNQTLQPDSTLGFILLFLAIVIIAPIGEEVLFRGFFQQFLEKYWKDITKAILVTSLFFAIIHMNTYWLIQIYILGVFLGYLSWKTNSIIPSIILHSINNGTAMILSFTNINLESLYLWNGHVTPWVLFMAVFFLYRGFKGINNS